MKTIFLILKGIVLYNTFILFILFSCTIDSLTENNVLIESFLVLSILAVGCFLCISKEEFEKLTFSNKKL